MPIDPGAEPTTVRDLTVYGAIAAAGGAARYVSLTLKGKSWRWLHLAGNAAVSGFVGMIGALAVKATGASSLDALLVAAGVAGWIGAEAMNLLIAALQKRAGAAAPSTPPGPTP